METIINKLQTYLCQIHKTTDKPDQPIDLYHEKIIQNCNFMINEKDIALDDNIINSYMLPKIVKINNLDNFDGIIDIVSTYKNKNHHKWVQINEQIINFKNDYINNKIIVSNYGDVNNLINDIQYYQSDNFNITMKEQCYFYEYYMKYINLYDYNYKILKLTFIKLFNNHKPTYPSISIKESNSLVIKAYNKIKNYVNVSGFEYKLNKHKLERFVHENQLDLLYYTKENEIIFEIALDRLLYCLKSTLDIIVNESTDELKNQMFWFIEFMKKFANSTKNNFSEYLFRYPKKYILTT
jgi:hypothetical protein